MRRFYLSLPIVVTSVTFVVFSRELPQSTGNPHQEGSQRTNANPRRPVQDNKQPIIQQSGPDTPQENPGGEKSDYHQNVYIAAPNKTVDLVERVISIVGVICTLALAIVGIVGICIAIKSLEFIKKQVIEMRHQAAIMRGQAGTLEDSVAAARDNTSTLVNIERAWLVAEVSPPKNLSQPAGEWGVIQGFGFEWSVKNCGRSPGFITKIGARFHAFRALSNLPPEPDMDVPGIQPSESYSTGIPLAPGERLPRYRMAEEGTYPSPADVKLIADGAITYLGYGVIEYKTVLDDTIYKTWFCHRWLPNQIGDVFPHSPIPADYTKYT